MKPTDAERDLAFDRLIARGLSREADATGNACPDADLLAAWFDRSLSAAESDRIETHAAGCASCQQILADLARSEPPVVRAAPEPAPAKPWHWHWRWAVPLATAAIVVMVATRPVRAPGDVAQSTPAAVEQAPSKLARQDAAQGAPELPPQSALAAAPQYAPPAAPQNAPRAAPATAFPAAPRTVAETAKSVAASGPEPQATKIEARKEMEGPAAEKPFAAADAMGRVQEAIGAPTPARTAQAGASNVGFRALGVNAELRVPPLPATATSPSGKVAWRVGAAGAIDRSLDGGRTWQRQESGVGVTLASASAVNDSVCWAAGQDGVVLRTTDGTTWQRAASPAVLPFLSIRAESADAANVRAADGSEFSTTDGGRTWTKK